MLGLGVLKKFSFLFYAGLEVSSTLKSSLATALLVAQNPHLLILLTFNQCVLYTAYPTASNLPLDLAQHHQDAST